jgi:hypothetical protein
VLSAFSFFIAIAMLGYVLTDKPQRVVRAVNYSGDALMTQAIQSKFAAGPDTKGSSISVQLVDGAVLLSGFAKTRKVSGRRYRSSSLWREIGQERSRCTALIRMRALP